MKESLNLIRRDLQATAQKVNNPPRVSCPEVAGNSNCVSTTIFITLMVVQLIILISYLMYRWGEAKNGNFSSKFNFEKNENEIFLFRFFLARHLSQKKTCYSFVFLQSLTNPFFMLQRQQRSSGQKVLLRDTKNLPLKQPWRKRKKKFLSSSSSRHGNEKSRTFPPTLVSSQEYMLRNIRNAETFLKGHSYIHWRGKIATNGAVMRISYCKSGGVLIAKKFMPEIHPWKFA